MKSKLKNKLIFKKFRTGKLIYNSNLAIIHEGINELNKEPVALKFEKISGKYNFLESEAYFLFLLQSKGIPKLISYGKSLGYRVLIEELLGQSIYLIWKMKYSEFKNKLNDICLIAIQCIDRLEYIHSKNIIHRDIKPLNFLVGRKDPNLIYLIDFGISKKYRSSRTGKHIKFGYLKKTSGSIRYMSINTCKGYVQSRRDDLESLGYMLIYLIKQSLPWLSLEKLNMNKVDKNKKIMSLKKYTSPEQICYGLPKGFFDYVKYCRKLSFEEDPNYNYLRHLFLDIIKSNEKLTDYRFINFMRFSWIKNNSKIGKIETFSNNNLLMTWRNENNSLSRERKNTHKRLYRLIKDSFEKARSQELPTTNNNNFFKFDLKNINIILNNIETKTNNKNQKIKNIEKKTNEKNKTRVINYSSINNNISPINTITTNVQKNRIKKFDNFIYLNPLKSIKKNPEKKISLNSFKNIVNNNYMKSFVQTPMNSSNLDTYISYKNNNYYPEYTMNSLRNLNYKTLKERESEEKKNKVKNIFNRINNNNLNHNNYFQLPIQEINSFNGSTYINNELYRNYPNPGNILRKNIFYSYFNRTEDI